MSASAMEVDFRVRADRADLPDPGRDLFRLRLPSSAAIPALYQLTTVVGLVMLARTRRFGVFRTTQLLAFLVLPALLQASLGGFVASSAMILWGASHRSRRLPCRGLRRSVVWFVAFFDELVVLALLDLLYDHL